MRKEIINAIVQAPNTPFGRTVQMTADERTELRESMEQAGAGWNMLYQRMTYRGFDAWELSGINRCMTDFWSMLQNPSTMPPLSSFWQTLIEQGHNIGFIKYMEAHGMSRNTTIKRFSELNFKPWELQGVEHILRSLEK